MVATLGPDHEMTLQLLTTRAQSHGSLEQWDAAIRDGMAVHRLAVAKQGPKSFFAIATLADVGDGAVPRLAREGRSRRTPKPRYQESLAAFGPDAALTQAVAYTRARA